MLRYSGAGVVRGMQGKVCLGCDANEKKFEGWMEENAGRRDSDDNSFSGDSSCDDDDDAGLCDVNDGEDAIHKSERDIFELRERRLEMNSEQTTLLMRWLQSSRNMAKQVEDFEKRLRHSPSKSDGKLGEGALDETVKSDIAEVRVLVAVFVL